jgi:hypothetical protein
MHDNWPQGETLDAAARRGDLICEMMRERGYTDPTAIVEDILASVADEERKERAEWAERHRGDLRGRTLHTLTPDNVASDAAFRVRMMVEIAEEKVG